VKILYSEQEAADYAKEAAKRVEIRSYENGCSRDDMRDSTDEERALLECAICAALWAIRAGYDAESAKAAAEFFVAYGSDSGGVWETHINTYGSVYLPIGRFLNSHEAMEAGDVGEWQRV